jgi:hypothetical protein
MARWIIPTFGLVVLVLAIGIAAVSWTRGGDGAPCDRAALAAEMRRQVTAAEGAGASQFTMSMPDGCADADLVATGPEVTRTWHTMPGGMMMRAPSHAQ